MSDVEVKDVLSIEKFDSIDSWRGLYTLGIISSPIWLTVSSQQSRAADMAISFINEIAKKASDLKRSDRRIRVAIVGAGIGGMTLAYCLHSYRSNKQSFTISIDIFERHGGICPIQRGCQTRRIHPTLQYWPGMSNSDEFTVKELLSAPVNPSLSWSGGISAGELASRLSREYFDRFDAYLEKGGQNAINIYEGCSYLLIEKNLRDVYSVTFQGHRIKDKLGNTEAVSAVDDYDAVFFATGFGVEREFAGGGVKYEATPYWRNDSLGQFNLNDEPHRYLISGNGDGAVSDVLRALIIDYKPDELLSEILGTKFSELLANSFNVAKNINPNDVNGMHNYLRYFIETELLDTSLSDDVLNELHVNWNISKQARNPHVRYWSKTDSVMKMIFKVLVWPKIKKNVEVIVHLKNRAELGEIINNPAVTFYNKFLFYAVWAAGRVTLKTGDLIDVARKHQIKSSNVIIRHGADSGAPIESVLSKSLYDLFVERKAAKLLFANDEIKGKYEVYRKGLRVT